MTRWTFSRARVTVMSAVLAVAAMAFSAPARADSSGVSYAALGDSYSSGVGAGGYAASSGTCYRGSHSYPALWEAAHPGAFDFAACSGATTSDVLADQLEGLSASTTLVTLTIGGNDVGFVEVVATCTVGSSSVCSAAVAAATAYARIVLPAKLAKTYAAIHAAAPNARIIVLGYPRLFETAPATCGTLGMSRTNRSTVNGGADVLDSVVQARAQAAGATFVDVRTAFAGHGVCGSSPWINGPMLTVLNSYHPNAAGYAQGYLPALEAVTG